MSSAITPYPQAPQPQYSSASYDAAPEAFALLNKTKRNPLSDFLSEEVYHMLRENDLLNEKVLRDYVIRKMFASLRRDKKLTATDALEQLRDVFSYLQPDTIRKIVYRLYPSSPKRPMI